MKRKQAETANGHQGQGDQPGRQDERDRRSRSETRGVLDFLDYLWAQETLEEALIAFFCLLELIKARHRDGRPGAALPHDQGLAAQGRAGEGTRHDRRI